MAEKIILNGAAGFIGRNLCYELLKNNYTIIALTRNPKKIQSVFQDKITPVLWDKNEIKNSIGLFENAQAVINFAGENISSGRWTIRKKKLILSSRLDSVKNLSEILSCIKNKPEVFIQASAIGYYGDRADEQLTESSSPGSGFLSEVIQKLEKACNLIENTGIRSVILRIGVVLGKEGGALPKLILPYKFFAGGPVGKGSQWFSWIHLEDLLEGIKFLINNKEFSGIFNMTASNPLTIKDFSKILGKVMKRPSWVPVPGFILKLIYGEMAQETLLSGSRVIPEKLIRAGFEFEYPDVKEALKKILNN
ncbi:TIGR01777 family oxidoreductase [candidate division KSB1 bacterium]